VWPVILLAGLPFAPESPYWLVRKNRKDDAREALLKLSSKKHRPDIEGVLVMIEQTDLLEQELEVTTTYFDCFKGANWLRTEISIMVYLIQVIGGNPLIGYANFFFEQAGLNSSDAFNSQYFTKLYRTNPDSYSGRGQHGFRIRRHLPFLATNVICMYHTPLTHPN
jgi:MFS transporter, SP family, general alpha glucoside:H+ symporter